MGLGSIALPKELMNKLDNFEEMSKDIADIKSLLERLVELEEQK